MKFLKRGKDGGPYSTVTGYWLVEIKSLFSIAILCFDNGSRDAYHTHAFNCISWVLRGCLVEHHRTKVGEPQRIDSYSPSLRPVITRRSTFHRVVSIGTTWVLTFRGPWAKTWREFSPVSNAETTLTSGRKIVKGP